MPSGSTHDRITLWILPWVVGATYYFTRHGELTLIVAGAFLFSGLMFGPDLDIYSQQYKRWGKLRWIWLPYRKMFSHRSFFSHGMIMGTIIRVIYLLLFISIILVFAIAIAQLIWGFDWNWQQFTRQQITLISTEYLRETVCLFWGLELGAMSHSISDWLSSIYKQQRQRKLKTKKISKVSKSK